MQNIVRLCLACLFFIASLSRGFAQITDDFSDGDFSQNPAWVGDTPNFIVNPAGELQLMAPDAGVSVLSVQGNIADSSIWKLDARMEFAPSAANLLRIYLLADQSDLPMANGYFLELGENGSTDAIRFFRQDGAVKTLLATGTPGLVANDPVVVSLVVRRATSGLWTLEAAANGNPVQTEFALTDATYAGGPDHWFGVQCVYSATRKDKFFFDNISILPDSPDAVPPVLVSASAVDASTIAVVFDENVDTVSALNPANYSITGQAQPGSVAMVPNFPNSVQLTLAAPLTASGTYTLQTDHIADLAGNVSAAQTTDFQFINIEPAAPFDLVINEIMSDPTPLVGLPDVEWVELYNRSGKYIELQTLRFGDSGGNPNPLPAFLLYPDSFVVLCSTAGAASLGAVAPHVLSLSGFPSLNNTGDWLILSDQAGNVINQVVYDLSWHTDPDKADGGWSLERINPTLPCLGSANWQSCPALPGGTPGVANASLQTNPDVTPPHLLSVTALTATTLYLQFSEGLDATSAENISAYQITPSVQILSAIFPTDNHSLVELTLAAPLQSGVQYALSVSAALQDCSGNSAQTGSPVLFGLAEIPVAGDLLFNEIMANPTSDHGLPDVEWVELYNGSGKFLQLESLLIMDAGVTQHVLPAYVLAPDSFLVLSNTDGAMALSAVTGNVLGLSGFPTLNDDIDALILGNSAGEILDRVVYTSAWHTDPDKAGGGYSLERINPTLPCLGKENWITCPAVTGGTPGRQNAGFNLLPDITAPHLLSAYPQNANTLLLRFSEGLDQDAVQNINVYQIDPPRQIASADFVNADKSLVELTLAEALQTRVVYTLTLSAALTDCSGNAVPASDTALVGLPEKPDSLDVVINEILYNPGTGGSRYVEVLNRSDKIFDLAAFSIRSYPGLTNTKPVTTFRLFFPGEYLVFATDPANVAQNFAETRPDWLLLQDLPSLVADPDNISFFWEVNGQKVVVDSLEYFDDWHNALLTVGDRDGVALERIRPEGPTNSASNWTSAASIQNSGAGTPTRPNSQHLSTPGNEGDQIIQLPLARLSPDDDGFEDFLDIRYQLPNAGYAATITIYDADGVPLKHLVRQELIGTEGGLRWDGDTDSGGRARPGIHILYAEVFAPTGEVKRVKKAFAVVAKF